MIHRTLTSLFCLFSLVLNGQVLRDINYNYTYSPALEFSLEWKVIRQAENFEIFYQLQLKDTLASLEPYTVQWETRSSLGDKEGTKINSTLEPITTNRWNHVAKLSFPIQPSQQIIVAKVISTNRKTAWLFHKPLPQEKIPYLSSSGVTMRNSFITREQRVVLEGFDAEKTLQVSYYNDPFPAGAPAFSTAQGKVAKLIKPDSAFVLDGSATLSLTKKGLYLAQLDTASAKGLAFRVEDDYPKLSTLESLAGPLIYICTKQEYEKLIVAGDDKKKFDQVILSITGNSDRARTFMRNYFKRVELANVYFNSYKEGWKTDRGMIYIIFGLPEEVYLFDDREIWVYKNENTKVRFQFVKSSSVFDPNNYVLLRDKKITDTWYNMIDLWRKARF